MAKQLNVNLAFGADTSKAKAAMEDLSKTLAKIQSTPGKGGLIDDVSIRRAAEAAKELQQHLNRAMNADTGKLDLNRFSQSLKSSGKDLKSYYNDLNKIGPAGDQAFLKLSRSIATAETSTIRINKRMQEFVTTLKNTARWQISSSVLHGLMGAVQSAYGYAQDLNASLNDIRIVTGASAEQMEKFAEKANRAAKALSTTTTEYTKASLIYFQQGLSDSEVEARTNVTIKMANAAGQSAEIISDQLTAVWNNFYDGTQSLEHFADAMVRLGADTASSSDEIAAGLEKFASIGPMIGLGFDEAAAALATVTAQTRQSADVVGTAYKTIFARIQGLNLGETLDDGTTLNKYSQALAKVGISIKDQNGAIKDMNDLIMEMGSKWQNISKDQQIALAQAVGGVRQYNQIVALMDNFDFYEENLASAKNADGSLDVQAAIYAESWEAAQDRVRAAAEGVYDSLLNEDFFVSFNDGLSVLLGGVEGLVDGFGGMKGVIATIGSLMLRHFAKEAPSALKNLKENVQGILGLESKDSKKVVEDNNSILNGMDKTDPTKMVQNATIQSTQTLNKMTQQLNENQRKLSEEEKQAYQAKIDQVEATYDLLIAEGKELEQAEQKTAELEKQAIKKAAAAKIQEESEKEAREQIGGRKEDETEKQYESRVAKRTSEIVAEKRQKTESVAGSRSKESKQSQQEKEIKKQTTALKNLIKESEKYERMQRNAKAQAKSWRDNADAIKQNEKEASALANKMKQALKHMGDVDESTEGFKTLQQLLESGSTDVDALIDAFEKVANSDAVFDPIIKKLDELDENIADVETSLNGLGMDGADIDALEEDFREGAKAVQDFEEGLQNLEDAADEAPQHIVKTSEALASVGAAAGALVGMMSSIEGTMDVFSDEDATTIQKVGVAFGLLTTVVATATTVMEAAKKVEDAQILSKIKNTAVTGAHTVATGLNAIAQKGLAAGFKATIAPILASGAALKAHPVMWIASIIMIAVGAIAAITTALDKAKEKRAEEAKVTKEAADAIYEEVQANNELVRSYEDALQAYRDGKGSKEDLAAATEALLNVYEVENADLLIAAGRYDELTAAIKRAEQAKLDQAKAKTQTAVADAEQVFEDQMRDGVGHFSGGDYIAKIGGGASSKDEKAVKNAVNDLIASGDINGDIISHDGNDINLNTGQTTQDLIAAYEEMQKLQNYLAQNVDAEVLDESENYQNLVDWLAKSSESYQNLIDLQGQLESVSVQSAKNQIVSNHGTIDSLEEYRQAEEDLANALMADKSLNLDADAAKKLAQEALAAEQSYAEMALNAKVLDQATAATAGNVSSEQMEDFYNSLSDDEKTLFATLNFDSARSIEDLEAQLEVLQERAENTTIRTNLEAVENARSNLKDDMSVEDYKDFEKDSGLSWGEDGIIKYSEFLKMTYDEQAEYLESLNEKYADALEQSSEDLITANQNRIDEITNQLPELEEELSQMEQSLTAGADFNDNQLITRAQGLNPSSETYSTDLNNLANEYGVSAEDIQSYLDAYNNAVALNNEINSLQSEITELEDEAEINAILDFAQTKEDVRGLVDELNGLGAGDSIDEEQYKVLAEYLPQLKDQFIKTADGTYKLTDGLDGVQISWRELSALTGENGEKLLDSADIANSITSINDLRDAWFASAISYEDYRTRLAELVEQNLASAASLEELRAVAADAASRGALDYNAYAENLARLGEQYDNCTVELEEYQQALLSGDSAQIQAAESALELAIEIGELASKFDLDAQETENYAKRLADSLGIDEKAAAKLAVANQRVDRGLTNLNENLKDYSKSLKDNDKNSAKWSKTMDSVKKDLADVLNVADGTMLSDSFVEATLASEDLTKALDGDVEAIQRLQALAADDIMINVVANQSDDPEGIVSRWQKLKEDFAAFGDIDAPGVDQSGLLASFNEMIAAGNMTKDQIEATLAGLHVSANVKTTYVPQKVTVPQTITEEAMVSNGYEEVMVPGADGEWVPQQVLMKKKITRTYDAGTVEVDGVVPQYEIEGTEGAGGITTAFASAPAVTPSFESTTSGGAGGGGGGGGSSKPTSDARQKKTDVVDRYKEVNDQLDDMADALNDASKAADRLYGSARLKEMEKVSKNLQSQIDLLKEKKKQAEENLAIDKAALDAAAADVGLSFEYAGNNIVNYTEQMTDLYNRREALLDTFGEEIDEEEQKKLDELDKKIEELEEALGLYEETKELIEDIENEIDDAFYEWQDNNYAMLSYKLELEIEINDAELQKLDYLLNKYSDNFYKMAESAVEMNNKIDPTKENLADYRNHQLELDRAYAAGEISQADYVEGLKEVRDGYYENLEALIALDKEMMHYLEDTLSAASEEVAEFTDHMEHLTGVFDHYMNLMDILGKSKDYDAIGNFLGGKADTIRDRLTVAQEYYNMLKENSKADEYWANYQAALASGDEDMAQWWKEQWDAEIDALDEAQEEMLSLTEEWAEAMKAVVENNMAQLTDNLEKSLTNGLGFDKLMDDFDKLNTRQEEYLTKTNQIYETNKLMRTASKALDETDNKVAKQKLKNFIDETKSLQENTQLSKYELEIQQAKYDLLLAEIALEEAQNAKSTVRLSQDSEGNFGYVYTADQDKISDAQQGVDDAENNLYNIALNGQQEYTEKYLQSQQQMLEDLDELWRLYYEEGAIDQEEYNRRYAEIQAHYYGPDGILTTYANLYNIGVQTDADATADNWQKNYGAMTQNTSQWASNVNTYYQGVQEQIKIWEDVSVQANTDVEGALTNSKTATRELKEESSELAETLTDEIIPAIDEELEAVAAQTAAYAAQREALLALIAEYENYIDAINASIAAQAGVSTNDNLGFDPDTDYSALMNEYLSKGGTTSDKTFLELQKQREAKIAWLQTDAGGNKGADYWGTSGQDTIDKYNRILSGGGSEEENAWFNADYVKDEELVGIFEKLGVPIDEIQAKLDALKEATDNTNTKIDESKDSITETVKETGETTNTKVDEAKEQLNEAIKTSAETTDETIKSTGETSDGVVTDTGETTDGVIEDTGENTVSSLQDVADVISSESGDIQIAIADAASTVGSSVGGAISSLSSQISGLQGSMSALTAISALDALIPFASGGYTGDWGPEGKLAVLHEKELVLNQGDTANLLTSISFLRDIVSVIDSQASMASMFNMSAMAGVSSNTETLEQMVTIHAEFPNATNHSEIEEAFNNLVNRASQYANRK